MRNVIRQLAQKYADLVVGYRRDFHQHPEIGFQEVRTGSTVERILRELRIETKTGVAGTGVLGLLRGGREGGVIALRADMDALPIEEKTGLPFASVNAGVMHACGHDMHTAILLGCAHILSELRAEIPGTVKFVFQPAEELLPVTTMVGAARMIADGALQNPKVDAIFGLHLMPDIDTGKAATRAGTLFASSDRFALTVKGKSCHGASPNLGVDAIVISANVVNALQTIVSRNVAPNDTAVITIGSIHGGVRHNILAESVKMIGTLRFFEPSTRQAVIERIRAIVGGVTESLGGQHEFEMDSAVPATVNDPRLVKVLGRVMGDVLGDDFILLDKPISTAEDFSYYGREVPAAFLVLGCRGRGRAEGDCPPLHHYAFNPDEKCIPYGLEIMANTVFEFLKSQSL